MLSVCTLMANDFMRKADIATINRRTRLAFVYAPIKSIRVSKSNECYFQCTCKDTNEHPYS